MPLYDYRCPDCGASREAVRAMRDHDKPLPCECGALMNQTIERAPMVNGSFLGSTRNPGYQCVVTGEWVDTRKRRREIEREHNLVEAA